MKSKIIGATESLAFVAIDQRHKTGLRTLQRCVEKGNSAVTMLANDQSAILVDSQPIGANATATTCHASVTGRLEKNGCLVLSFLPTIDGVTGYI